MKNNTRNNTTDGDQDQLRVVELPPRPRPDWLARCMRNENGKPLGNVANVLLALRDDAGLQDAFAYDEMQRRPMLMHPIGSPFAPFEPRAISDHDVVCVGEYLQHAGLKNVAREVVRDGISARARTHRPAARDRRNLPSLFRRPQRRDRGPCL